MRIAIVNDMPLAVEALRRVLAGAPEHQLAWVATDGAQAVQQCRTDTPDLLLMDLLMPGMDGVEATRLIMAETPCAILIVTGDVERNVGQVFQAMGHGAMDVVATPSLGGTEAQDAALLLRKIRNISMLLGQPKTRSVPPALPQKNRADQQRLVVVGASSGGPAALLEMLRQLPTNFAAALVLVQHVDQNFAASMAEWLTRESQLPVRLASAGEVPQPGCVLLAGSNEHLVMQSGGKLAYSAAVGAQIYCPSIDVFFDSVATHWKGHAVGVLLTGMGRDGADGLLHMRERGFATIAQDQASCAVYGMPKAAAAIGAAVEILPLNRIGLRLTELLS